MITEGLGLPGIIAIGSGVAAQLRLIVLLWRPSSLPICRWLMPKS